METRALIQSVRSRTGLDEGGALAAAEATLETMGELLTHAERQEFRQELPDQLAEFLSKHEPGQQFELDNFYQRVAQREGVAMGFGLEHAQAVCQEMSKLLDKDGRVFIRKRLPDDFAVLFENPDVSAVSPQYEAGPDDEIEPSDVEEAGAQPDHSPVHSDSVVSSSNPHGDRKLSTGSAAPNRGRDLNTGHAGPSEGRDLATAKPSDESPDEQED